MTTGAAHSDVGWVDAAIVDAVPIPKTTAERTSLIVITILVIQTFHTSGSILAVLVSTQKISNMTEDGRIGVTPPTYLIMSPFFTGVY